LKFHSKRTIARIIKTGKPVVLVLFTGRPLVLVMRKIKTVPAILNTWFAGSEAGTAIADVLFGDVNWKINNDLVWSSAQSYKKKNTGRPLSNKVGEFENQVKLLTRNEPLFHLIRIELYHI
jgi:beta-glucosidase